MTAVTAAPIRKPRKASRRPVDLTGWIRVIGLRVVMVPITIWIVVTITFFVTRIVGGNPAQKLAGDQPTAESIAAIEEKLGLDKPIMEQYWDFLTGLLRWDFGQSFYTNRTVTSEIAARLPGSVEIVLLGMILAIAIGIGLALLAARRPGSAGDHTARGFSILAFATPDFFLGAVLAFIFAFTLKWFPAPTGQLPFSISGPPEVTNSILIDSVIDGDWKAFGAHFALMLLPALTLGLIYFAAIFKVTRGALIGAAGSEFVLYADAAGLTRGIRRRYVLRHALSLVVTHVGVMTVTLLGGAVLVEQVYNWGGFGSYGVLAMQNNDFPAIQGFVVTLGLIAVGIYFVVDVLYTIIDPRVRL